MDYNYKAEPIARTMKIQCPYCFDWDSVRYGGGIKVYCPKCNKRIFFRVDPSFSKLGTLSHSGAEKYYRMEILDTDNEASQQ